MTKQAINNYIMIIPIRAVRPSVAILGIASSFLKKIRVNRKKKKEFRLEIRTLVTFDKLLTIRQPWKWIGHHWIRQFSRSFEQGRCQIAICEECGERMVAI